MKKSPRYAIIGSGSWATALAKLLLNNLESINWYIRRKETIAYFRKNKHNPHYLSSIHFETEQINFIEHIEEAIHESDILIFAIPSTFLKESLQPYKGDFFGKYVVSAIKGIIPIENLTVGEYFTKHYLLSFKEIGIITGPCHAEEVALEKLSYLTIASTSNKKAESIAEKLNCSYIKTKTTKDIYGIEYAGVLKNIYAIAAGICHGLGYGDNYQAVLAANAAREIGRFLDKTYKLKGKRKINNSAFLGDLLVTAYSQFSRNRTFGAMIGKGYTVRSAQLEMNMIAEGYNACYCIQEMNKEYNVKMPIMNAVYNILFENIAPAIEIKLLSEQLD